MSSKQNREFFEQIKSGEKEGVQAIAPGLSLSKVLGDIGNELKNQAAHGSHEMAAALFNGSPFVMYPRTKEGKEDPQHGLPEKQQEQSNQGREM